MLLCRFHWRPRPTRSWLADRRWRRPVVHGDAVLGEAVHLVRPDVHLQRLQLLRRAERQHSRVQALQPVVVA